MSHKNKNMVLLVFYLLYLKYWSVVFVNKYKKMFTIYYQETKWSIERNTALNIHWRENLGKGGIPYRITYC